MTVRDALNSALDEELARDPTVYILGEEVRAAGERAAVTLLFAHTLGDRRLVGSRPGLML